MVSNVLALACLVAIIGWEIVNWQLHGRIREARDAFLARAREVMPLTVIHEYDMSLLPWRFWCWVKRLDDMQVEDGPLLALAENLRRLARAHQLAFLSFAAIMAAGILYGIWKGT